MSVHPSILLNVKKLIEAYYDKSSKSNMYTPSGDSDQT